MRKVLGWIGLGLLALMGLFLGVAAWPVFLALWVSVRLVPKLETGEDWGLIFLFTLLGCAGFAGWVALWAWLV